MLIPLNTSASLRALYFPFHARLQNDLHDKNGLVPLNFIPISLLTWHPKAEGHPVVPCGNNFSHRL